MDLITIIIIAGLVGALLIALFFYKMKKGKGSSTAKDKSKEKGKKKSKKGESDEEAEPATARSAVDLTHVQTQVNALIQQKEYAKAEGLLNASLKDDNTLYPLYANLLNVYHLQDDEFAINQLFNSIEKQGLNEIYQKLNAEHESYKNIKAQELINQPVIETPVIADEPEVAAAPQTNTSAFDDLALDFNPASKAATAEPAGNSLDFSPSNNAGDNSLDFKSANNDNSLDFAKAAVAATAVTAATAAVASQTDNNSLSFDDLKTEDNSLSFDSLQSSAPTIETPSLEVPTLEMPNLSTPSVDAPSLSFDTPSLNVESNSLDFAPSTPSSDFNLTDTTSNELQFESNSINLAQPEVANELTLPELTVPEVSVPEVAEPSLSFNIDDQVPSLSVAEPVPLSTGELSFNLGDAPAVESPKPDFSFNLDAPSVETSSTPSTSFVLDAEPTAPVAPVSEDIGTFDLSNSTLLDTTPSTPSNEFQFDIPSTPSVETSSLPEVTGNTFDVPSLEPSVAPIVTESVTSTPVVSETSDVLANTDIDSNDPLVVAFPNLAQVEPVTLDLDLVEQYIKLGQFDAARSLLNEVQAIAQDDVKQRIADLQEKIV